MKLIKNIIAGFCFLFILASCSEKSGGNIGSLIIPDGSGNLKPGDVSGLIVMSSNVRYYSARNKADDPDTGDRDWENRKVGYFAMVNELQPHVMGVQEAEYKQLTDITANCAGYSYVGVCRVDGNTKGESTAIFYKDADIQVEQWGTVWLSPTPDVVNSRFDEMTDGNCRTATWAVLKYKETGDGFFYINTHLSLGSSQKKEVAVILNTVVNKNKANLPVVLTGDWNVEENAPALSDLNAVYLSARKRAESTDNNLTYHWWGDRNVIQKHQQLDHIFYKGFAGCPLFCTINEKWKGYYISDHYPVYAVFQFSVQN